MFVWELLEMLIHCLPEVVGNSNRKFWLCWFTTDTVLSKGVFERRTPIRSGLFAFMSKFIKRKYSRSTNVVASHDGTLKWKSPHFRLTCAIQKRLCLSSLLGQWCVSLTPNNTKTIERMTCHCFLGPIRRDFTNSSYTTALLGMHKNHRRQNKGRRPFLLDKKAMADDIKLMAKMSGWVVRGV